MLEERPNHTINPGKCNERQEDMRKGLEESHLTVEIPPSISIRTPLIPTCTTGPSINIRCESAGHAGASQLYGNQGKPISTRREIIDVVLETGFRAARLEQQYKDLQRKRKRQARKKRKADVLVAVADDSRVPPSSTHEGVLRLRGRMWYIA